MADYHISPATQKVGICKARPGHCPFKGQHYSTAHEATRANLKEQMGDEMFNADLVSTDIVKIYSDELSNAFITSKGEASEEAYRYLEKKQELAYAKAYRAFSREVKTLDIPEEEKNIFHVWAVARAEEHEKGARTVSNRGVVPREQAIRGSFFRSLTAKHKDQVTRAQAEERYKLWVKEMEVNTQAHTYNRIAAEFTGSPLDKDSTVKNWLGNKAIELQATTPPPVRKKRPNPYAS